MQAMYVKEIMPKGQMPMVFGDDTQYVSTQWGNVGCVSNSVSFGGGTDLEEPCVGGLP